MAETNYLDDRLLALVGLTQTVVFDDQIKEFIAKNKLDHTLTEYKLASKISEYMNEKTLMKSNKRRNPQHSMFFENLVSHIDPNGPLYDHQSFEVEVYVNYSSNDTLPMTSNDPYHDPLNYTTKHKVVRTME